VVKCQNITRVTQLNDFASVMHPQYIKLQAKLMVK